MHSIEQRRLIEEKREATALSAASAVSNIDATDNDVLLGRGVPFQRHPGNVMLANLINDRREEYRNGKRSEKTAITWDIVYEIQNHVGGRFLEKEDAEHGGAWKVATDFDAREKVSVGFRSNFKMERCRQYEQQHQQQQAAPVEEGMTIQKSQVEQFFSSSDKDFYSFDDTKRRKLAV